MVKILGCRLDVCFDEFFYIFSMYYLNTGFSITGEANLSILLMRNLSRSAFQLKISELFIRSKCIGNIDLLRRP
jgi:hypothetical protein